MPELETPPPPPAPRPRRRRRIACAVLVVLAILPAVAILASLAALRASPVRRAILARVSALLLEDYGLAFAAEDFTPEWWRSGVELRNVRLGAPGEAPLATAERLRMRVDLGSLRRRPLVLRRLEADGLRVDLMAKTPQIRRSAPAEGGAAVEILRLAVRRGEVVGAPVEGGAARWLRRWSVREIEARGSYRDGRLDGRLDGAEALLDRPGFRDSQRLGLVARLRYEEARRLVVDELRATGVGVRLAAKGAWGLAPGVPTALELHLHASSAALAGALPPRGDLALAGRLELPRKVGRLTLRGRSLPAEALLPYLGRERFDELALGGTLVDLAAEASAGPREPTALTGGATLTWREGARPLGLVRARLLPSAWEGPLDSRLDVELLPRSPGRRRVSGTLRAPGWGALAEVVGEELRIDLQLPDVAATAAELRARWPRAIAAMPPSVPLVGSLVAEGRLSGPLLGPQVVVEASWVPRPGSAVHLEARGRPRGWSGTAKARLESVPLELLGSLAPGLAGSGSGTVELSGAQPTYRAHFDLATSALSLPPYVERVEEGTLRGEGTLALSPLGYRGTLAIAGTGLAAAPGDSRLRADRFAFEGREVALRASPLLWSGTAAFEGRGLALAARGNAGAEVTDVARVDHLTLAGEGRGSADLLSFGANVRLDADRIAVGEAGTELRNFHLEADGSSREIHIAALSAELPQAGKPGPLPKVVATGLLGLDPRLAAADLRVSLERPVDGLTAATLTASLHDGVLELDAPNIDSSAGEASGRARIPLGALQRLPQLAGALDVLSGPLPTGPATFTLTAPALDSAPLVAALGIEGRPERIRAGLDARLTFDLAAPALGRGEVKLTGLSIETPDGTATAEGPLVLALGDGRLEVLPVHLSVEGGTVAGAGIDLGAQAELDPRWRLEDPAKSAVSRLAAEGKAIIDASFLNAYLGGGVASGSLRLAGHASGPLNALDGGLDASGSGVSAVWPAAALRVDEPHLSLQLRDGGWTIRDGRAGLNGGRLTLTGGRSPGGALDLTGAVEDVRYRLAYGIDTLLSGRLAFASPADPPGGRSRLSGRLIVERGVLDRNVDLDRELLTVLFAPVEAASTEESALAAVDLDLQVETTDGVRVKNNVGDLHSTWRRLDLGGTLAAPVVRGRIDLDPGGRVFAYGQTVRIDRGSLLFRGDPLTDPQVDLATTSSLQDPRIARLSGDSPLDLLRQQSEDRTTLARERLEQEGARTAGAGELVGLGVASHYGARLAQRLGESVGLSGVSLRPVVVLEGADPSARLDVGRDLSRHVSLVLSLDLRNAEHRTYLLAVGSFAALPNLRLEGFTNDSGHHGGSLQQSFELGGGEARSTVAAPAGPRLRRIGVTVTSKGISPRTIRRAVQLPRKRPLPAGAAFGAEVDVTELLRRRGYPNPRVAATTRPVPERPGWVDLVLAVEPGLRVGFLFAGDRPPRSLRPEITGLYRTDFYEPTSIEEMRQATLRAFRVGGHVDPQVTITMGPARSAEPDGGRTVTIHTVAGPRRSLATLSIAGVDEEVARLAAAGFRGTLARAELAAGAPAADRALLAALRTLGFPQAKIADRTLAEDGSRLVVRVEPGTRTTLAAVEVTGVEGEERKRLAALLPLSTGDPARLDLVSAGALRLETDLRERGFADAAVRTNVVPEADRPAEVRVAYEVAPGIAYRLAAVELQGGRSLRPAPLVRETGLIAGAPLSEASLEEARNRLFRTGAFTRVDTSVDKLPDGEARVSFALAERPRFRIGYGVRWESAVGTSAVVDLVDQGFLGRVLTLGVRGLYQPDDRSGRLYARTDRLGRTRLALESYFEQRRRVSRDDNLIEDRRELSIQASRPLGSLVTARLYARHRTTHAFQIDPDPFLPFDTEIRLPYLGAQLVRDTRDDPTDPRRGVLASVDLSGSGAFLGSDLDYVRLFAQAASLRSVLLASRSFTWAQSLRVGLAHPFRGQQVIREERFFAGGPYSVRGYDLESLGPQESLGTLRQAAGGEALLVLNEELRFPLPWDLVGLAFFDAGEVWARPGDVDADLAKSLGLGLRARTPLGLLRFDAAYPLDRRPGDARYKLYLGFGNAF